MPSPLIQKTCCSNHSLERHLWYADFSKALSRLSSSRDYKRTQQEALAVLILYIYYRLLVHAITISIRPLSPCCYLISITHPPCFLYVPWRHTLNLHCTCAHYVYTMRNSCPLTSSPNPNSSSRLFLILLDPKSFQTALDSITWLPGHVPIS